MSKPADDGPNLMDDRQVLQRMPTIYTSALAVSAAMAADDQLPHDVRGIGLYLAAKLHALPDDTGFSTSELRVLGTSPQRVLKALEILRERGHIDENYNPIMRAAFETKTGGGRGS